MKLAPGDKVRATQHRYDQPADGVLILLVAKGSICEILPHENIKADELETFEPRRKKNWFNWLTRWRQIRKRRYADHLNKVQRETIARGEGYPARILEMPESIPDLEPGAYVECAVGYEAWVFSDMIEKIEGDRKTIEIDFTEHLPELSGRPVVEIVQQLLAGECEPEKVDLTMLYVVKSGYRFTSSELKLLKPSISSVYEEIKVYGSFALHFLLRGYVFEFDEVQAIGNPTTAYGITLAHWMARKGHKFNKAEIKILGNPINELGETIDKVEVERYSSQDTSATNGIQQLLFQDGEPIFAIDGINVSGKADGGKHVKEIEIGFGEYMMASDGRFLPDNVYIFSIQRSDSGWAVRLKKGAERNALYVLRQKVLVMELVKMLNVAIEQKQPLDFTDYIEILRRIYFPTGVEVYPSPFWGRN